MKKVLIPTKLDSFAAELLQKNGFTVIQDAESGLDKLVTDHNDSSVLIVRSEKITAAIIDALPNLQLIVRAGAGYNTIDTKYARRCGVDVMNTPGANSNAVAEEVIAMMLGASRHLVRADISTRQGKWEKKKLMGRELTGKTMGIIGLGNIGRLVAKRLEGFDMKFIGFDPMISASLAEQLGIELCPMEEIFRRADFISLHIPENDETRKMINCRYFELMRDGAMLINCARAGIINEDDLRAAKQKKNIIFCNDVYPKDAAGEKSVADIADLMLPHLGASTFEANFNAAKRAAEQTIAYFEQGITDCVVNKDIPDGLDANYQRLASLLTEIAHAYLGSKTQPVRIESSFYGDLAQYAKWMLAPITAALSKDFDPYLDAVDAEKFLAERGIEYKNREVCNDKNYGNSITIDLLMGDDVINKVSVRGTLTEGHLMVSRINNFDCLYLAPSGYNLFVEYNDAPGMIGKIAGILGEHNINIIDIRAPQDLKINRSLATVKTDVPVGEDILAQIKIAVGANVAFCYNCKG